MVNFLYDVQNLLQKEGHANFAQKICMSCRPCHMFSTKYALMSQTEVRPRSVSKEGHSLVHDMHARCAYAHLKARYMVQSTK